MRRYRRTPTSRPKNSITAWTAEGAPFIEDEAGVRRRRVPCQPGSPLVVRGGHADTGGRTHQGHGGRQSRRARAVVRPLCGAGASIRPPHRARARGCGRGAARRLLGGVARRRRLRSVARHAGGLDHHARANACHRPRAPGAAAWRDVRGGHGRPAPAARRRRRDASGGSTARRRRPRAALGGAARSHRARVLFRPHADRDRGAARAAARHRQDAHPPGARAAARGGDLPVSHEPFETLAAVYAVGALDGDDLAQFEAHLPTCAVCQAALREAQDALARAMLSTPPQARPAAAREALVRRVGRARGADRRSWLRWAAATAVVAAAAAGFTGTWVAVRYEARLGQMARETAAVKERLARNEASLRDQLLYRGAVELLADPATRVVDLRAQGPAPAASGRMIWNDVGGGHLFVAGLPPTPAGKTYALWAIAGGTPRPAGLFDVDAAGRGTLRIAPASTGAAARVFVVTVEPEGGAPAP